MLQVIKRKLSFSSVFFVLSAFRFQAANKAYTLQDTALLNKSDLLQMGHSCNRNGKQVGKFSEQLNWKYSLESPQNDSIPQKIIFKTQYLKL